MYLDLIVLAVLLFPVWGVTAMINKKAKPFYAVGIGAVFAGAGALTVMMVAVSSGVSISDAINNYIEETVKILINNPQYMDMLNEMGVKTADASGYLTKTYEAVAQILPALIFIVAGIVSYIEYNLIVKLRYRKKDGYKPLAYIRNFSLNSEDVLGWFAIYCIGYLLHIIGISNASSVVMNINVMIEMIIALQGISFVMLVGNIKRIPKAIVVVILLIGWMIPVGKSVIFVIGMIDLIFNIRRRMINVK